MWEILKKEDVLKKIGSNEKTGLGRRDIKQRKQKYGLNKLEDKPQESLLVKFIKQFDGKL